MAEQSQQRETKQPPRFPLLIDPQNRDATTAKDARLVNGYVETNKETNESWIFKRPGLNTYTAQNAATGDGIYNWRGDIYEIWGSSFYRNGILISALLNNSNGQYRFSSCLGATRKLQLGNGVAAYNYDTGGGLVPIAGANFPTPFVKGWAYLDGTTYVMSPDAEIRGCTSLNDPATWTDVLNTIDAQIEPDDGVALAKQLVYVIAFKQWTTEVFYDARNATGSPLSPVQGAKVNFGCANADSVREIDGALFWVATNRDAAPQIVTMDGLKATVVSTKAVERLLETADLSSVRAFTLKYGGHRFYGVTFRANNLTVVYDVVERRWDQWTDTQGNYFPLVGSSFTTGTGITLMQHESNGRVYTIDQQHYSDDGAAIVIDIYTPNADMQTRKRKTVGRMTFIADQVANSTLYVRTNDRDYDPNAWTTFRPVDLGSQMPHLDSNGTFTRRAMHLRHQDVLPFRIQAVEMEMDLGTL